MLVAYHNDEALKIKTINAMQADIAAERLQPGHYWNGKTGCFVGCVIRGELHSKFEDVLGIPRILAKLGDRLYEGLGTQAEKQKFAVDFLFAITPGSDLSSVWTKFAHYMLVDPEHGVLNFAKTERTKKSIQAVADLYQRKINGEDIDVNTWLEAKRNAAAADATAADAYAADAYAAYAAYAADADADAAAYAAYAADADADAAAYAAYAAAAYADAAAADADADAAADAYAAAAAARSRHFAALAAALIRFLGDAK